MATLQERLQPSGSVRSSSPSKVRSLRGVEIRWGYLFITPWIIGFLLFTLFPMGASLYLSFTDYSILESREPQWIGSENYARILGLQVRSLPDTSQSAAVLDRGYSELFRVSNLVIGARDTSFWISLWVTLKFMLLSLPLTMAFGLFLAILLNTHVRGVRVFRTLIYSPVMMPAIAAGVIFQRLLGEKGGWINQALGTLGIVGPNWLGEPRWALLGLSVISLWSAGGSMLIYLAGLQSIPTELYEAARVDGANLWVQFRKITLPMLSPVLLYNLVLGLITLFQYFAIPYALTDGTGRPEQTTFFYNMYLYKSAWGYGEMGYGSALAWVLFAIVLALTLIVFRTSGRWVFYAGRGQN